MKPSFYAVLFLSQFLATIVRVTFAQDSNCACDNIDSVEEIFFVPEENTPLDQDCLNVITEPALQDVHDLAEPRLVVYITFRI